MAHNYQSTSTAATPTSYANLNGTPPPAFPATLPPSEIAPSPGPNQHPSPIPAPAPNPAPPYSENDLGFVGRGSMTPPPPPYAKSILRLINGDAETRAHAYTSSPPSLRYCPAFDKPDSGASFHIGAKEDPGSIQTLCGPYIHHDCAGRLSRSPIRGRLPIYCATCALASSHLNYNVGLGNYAYRWRTTEGHIPVGIHLSSFGSQKQRSLVRKCLKIVLQKLNDNLKPVGPQFRFVEQLTSSAFVVTFRGEHRQCYASAFFPDSNPSDWYINIYKSGITLCSEQKQRLQRNRRKDTKRAQIQALEQNLIHILTHEMLHIVGVRHCVVDENIENAPYVRFPVHLPDEDNQDPLMRPVLGWEDLSRFDLKPQTVEEIRQIYAKTEGDSIGPYIVRDVSWRRGARSRKKWLESMYTME